MDYGQPTDLGDFTWSQTSPYPFVEAGLAGLLQDRFGGLTFRDVKPQAEWEDVDTGRSRGALPEPFLGQLAARVEVVAAATVPIDWARSSILWDAPDGRRTPECPTCGRFSLQWNATAAPRNPLLVGVPAVRDGQQGPLSFVDTCIGGADFWYATGDGESLLCSDSVAAYIRERGLTNVAVEPVGVVLPG